MNILFTSVGRRSYLIEYFKEALKGEGEIHVMNSSDISPAFLIADKAAVSPLIYDENYIPFLLDYCVKNDISAVISLFDIDLPVLALNKHRFEQIGTKVIVADYEKVEICNDKWKTFLFLKEEGFKVPKTYLDLETVKSEIRNGNIEFPLIIKPRWGMGSISILEAENEKELEVFCDKVRRDILKTYLKYESKDNLDESVLIQEKIVGQEYGLDIINDLDGKYINTIVKKKYAMRSGETDCAITVSDVIAENIGRELSGKMKHVGNLDVDVFKTADCYYVLEMNARFGGGYPFGHMAGVNLPLAIIKWLKGEKVTNETLTADIGVMSQKDISMVKLKTNS